MACEFQGVKTTLLLFPPLQRRLPFPLPHLLLPAAGGRKHNFTSWFSLNITSIQNDRLFHVAGVMKRQHFNTSSSAFPFSAGASSFSASGSSFFSSGLALATSFCFLALAGAAYRVKTQAALNISSETCKRGYYIAL